MKIDYKVGNKYTGFEWPEAALNPDYCCVSRISPYTGEFKQVILSITKEQYFAWRDGTLIQNAFPNLTADEREFILTGLLGDEFEKFVGSEEEEIYSDKNPYLKHKWIDKDE